MSFDTVAPRTRPEPFQHAALVYSSPAELLSVALPHLREGISNGEHVIVATTPEPAELLREGLGKQRGSVEFVDSAAWYGSPGATLLGLDEYVRRHEADGRPVRIVGGPTWDVPLPLQELAWKRYEALVNLAFQGRRLSTICLYDARTLDPGILATARETHPVLAGDGTATRPNDAYVDPAAFCAQLDAEPLPPAPVNPRTFEFTAADLVDVRHFVTDAGQECGLTRIGIEELVVAVNEITANAVRHGGGRGRLRAWQEEHHLVFEVNDEGESRPDPLAGHIRPAADENHVGGYGLWMARQLCDLVEVRHGPGWVVRLYADRSR